MRRDLGGQPRLAHAAAADERREPGLGHQAPGVLQVGLAADERRVGHGHAGPADLVGHAERLEVDRDGLVARVDAQLLREHRAAVVERDDRRAAVGGRGQGLQQRSVGPLDERVGGDRLPRDGDRLGVPALAPGGRGHQLGHLEPQLVDVRAPGRQPRCLDPGRELLAAEADVRAEQVEERPVAALLEQLGRGRDAAAQRLEVALDLRAELEARRGGLDERRVAGGLPELGHDAAQGDAPGGRQLRLPDLLGEPLGRHPAGREGERRQRAPCARRADGDPPRLGTDRDLAEKSDLHSQTLLSAGSPLAAPTGIEDR